MKIIVLSSALMLTGCADSQLVQMREQAEAMHAAASQCFLDVEQMALTESAQCIKFAERFRQYGELSIGDELKAMPPGQMPRERLVREWSVLSSELLYMRAISTEAPESFVAARRYFNPEFVAQLKEHRNHNFKKRKPVAAHSD